MGPREAFERLAFTEPAFFDRIRALASKAPPRNDRLDVNERGFGNSAPRVILQGFDGGKAGNTMRSSYCDRSTTSSPKASVQQTCSMPRPS